MGMLLRSTCVAITVGLVNVVTFIAGHDVGTRCAYQEVVGRCAVAGAASALHHVEGWGALLLFLLLLVLLLGLGRR